MLKILLKKQLLEINRGFFYDQKKGRRRSRASSTAMIIAYLLLMVGILGGMFTFLASQLCTPLVQAGMGWLYFTLCSLVAVALGVFGSVFNTYAGLYLAKDNDLLLSLPIPVRLVLAARMLGVYLMGLMYSGVVLIPAIAVYFCTVAQTAASVLGCVLLLVLITIFVLFLSCLLGWVVAKISLKLKNRSFAAVFLSLVLFGAYYFVGFKAQTWIRELVENAAVYGAAIRGRVYPLYLLGRVGEGDGFAMLVVSAVVLGLFALTCIVLARSFLRIATASGKAAKAVYREKAARVRPLSRALLYKELRRFTSNPNYMLNCGFGLLFLPVAAVLLLLRGSAFLSVLTELFAEHPAAVPVLLCAAVCLLSTMNNMAAPSVSLEGKSLWLLQSLPVRPWQILRAKLTMQLLLTEIPVALCALCAAAISSGSPAERLLLVGNCLLFVLMMALFDLSAGTKWANVTWTSEITPIKQSLSVMLSLFGGWILAAAIAAGYLLGGWHLGGAAYLAVCAAVMLVFSLLLYRWLRRKGTKIIAEL